jgi:hypothetical protein
MSKTITTTTAAATAATLTALAALVLNASAPSAGAQTISLADSNDQFCAEIQRRLVDTPLAIVNEVEPDYEAFKQSKPAAEPLRTHQFIERDAAGLPQQLSCKTKSADHLRAVHGAAAARDPALAPRSCRNLQREIVMQVWFSLDDATRATAAQRPAQIMLQADVTSMTGSSWVKTPSAVSTDAQGRVNLRASALFAEWEDWRWKMMPESFRGNHYCHFVAPERVRALMTGRR